MRVHDLIHGSDRYTHVCNRMHLFHLSGKEGSEGRQWVASSVWGDAGGSTPQDVGTTSPRLRKWCYEFTDDVEEAFYAPVRDGKLTPVNGEPPSQAAVREALCVEAAGLCTAEEVPDMDWKAVADRERQEREEEVTLATALGHAAGGSRPGLLSRVVRRPVCCRRSAGEPRRKGSRQQRPGRMAKATTRFRESCDVGRLFNDRRSLGGRSPIELAHESRRRLRQRLRISANCSTRSGRA